MNKEQFKQELEKIHSQIDQEKIVIVTDYEGKQRQLIEYITRRDKHMIRYRDYGDEILVHSVNGITIDSVKCAYACKHCGAIYQSKGYPHHSVFPTEDPKYTTWTHTQHRKNQMKDWIEKICVCPDLDDRIQERWEKENS